ncbi:4'-phosphopantetheinyl transferase family protein [Pectobacterium actinidiae]|uniref:4'-phosphopantetheinyl transferase family protein n=1 Tax=Pectobacterium actinidiae TaxID=1507808 RepID=UPI003808B932
MIYHCAPLLERSLVSLGRDFAERLGLPRDIAVSALPISAMRKVMAGSLPSGSGLQGSLEGMGEKRRTEFVAGRLCAARSLRRMGIDAEFPLPVMDRLPVWPPGVLGSISHCATLAVAATALRSSYGALGIDVESLINFSTMQDIQPSVCSDQELDCLRRWVPCEDRAVTLAFSAKEALYKALFPLVGQFKDFHSAQLCGCESRSLVLSLTQDWSSQWQAGAKVRVQFAWYGNEVLSAVCLPSRPPAIAKGDELGA